MLKISTERKFPPRHLHLRWTVPSEKRPELRHPSDHRDGPGHRGGNGAQKNIAMFDVGELVTDDPHQLVL